MKIAILTGPFGLLPPFGIGAIEKRWFNMAVEMAALGHSITFYCKKSATLYREIDGLSYCLINGYARTGHLFFDLFFDFIYTVKAISRLKKCDVMVLNTFWSPFLCPLFKRKYGISVYNVARYPKGQFRYMKCIDRLSCVSADVARAVVVQAPSLRNRVKVINNPVDVHSFPFQANTNTTSPCRICFTGRIHQEKGIDILVKACNSLEEKGYTIELSIIGARDTARGGGGEAYIDELNRLVKGYPVRWIDPIANAAELAKEISKCDVYCYPSVAEQGETFGVAPLEAMAVGCPTVVSALNCFTDFIEDGVTGLVFNHRGQDAYLRLAEKIEWLILHPEARASISQEGSRVAHERFNTEYIAAQYLEDFHQLLQEHCS
ncbi:MAG: glycosyltransferase family 4 protein [Bacilli bacterium]|nr:glycosyltransferase family 4 protein [Bacilli bacterium]